MNYISFLKSWGVIQQQLGSPLSRKRSTSDASIPNSPESVDAISGATITTKAVTHAVNGSLLAFNDYVQGGAGNE